MVRGATFDSDGIEIVYDDCRPDAGAGEPIVLVHGFASNRANNWQDTGWYDRLLADGRRVIALDNRGHGESDAPHDPSVYDVPAMGGDVLALLDHLDVSEADLFGYSMGGRIGTHLVQAAPDRFNAAVLAGIGTRIVGEREGDRGGLARALVTDDVDAIDNETARSFRLFAEQTGADREALAAVIRAQREDPPDHDPESVSLPVLVAAGSDDEIIGDPAELATQFDNGESAIVHGVDHLSTVRHEEFFDAVTAFLRREGL